MRGFVGLDLVATLLFWYF